MVAKIPGQSQFDKDSQARVLYIPVPAQHSSAIVGIDALHGSCHGSFRLLPGYILPCMCLYLHLARSHALKESTQTISILVKNGGSMSNEVYAFRPLKQDPPEIYCSQKQPEPQVATLCYQVKPVPVCHASQFD